MRVDQSIEPILAIKLATSILISSILMRRSYSPVNWAVFIALRGGEEFFQRGLVIVAGSNDFRERMHGNV